jgi:predicted metal-dependent phosphoesterase TrpH
MATVDLHIHSNYSNDGEFTPDQLVALCLQAGLTHAAIADHNSVKAIDEALNAAEGSGLMILPAIEMDCEIDGINLHVLGYGVDHTNPVFSEIEADLHRQEQENTVQLMSLVRQMGIEFDQGLVEDMAFDGVVTGEMIAEAALLYDAEASNPLLDPYRGDGDRSDNPYVNFYWDYCSQGKPAYTPMEFISLSQAISIIRSNHGVPVLAHPGVNVKENDASLKKIIVEGVLGIEVYSSYHNREQVRFYRQIAQSKDLLVTCGSDFHGKTKKSIKIGDTGCDDQEQSIINRLLDAIAEQK